MESFSQKYDDDDGKFYKSLYPLAKKTLLDAKVVLAKSVETADQAEWSRTVMALKSIGESMCYQPLKKNSVSYKEVTKEGLNELNQIIDAFLKN